MPGFFRLLAARVAYSRQLRCQLPNTSNTSDAMQSDCICISTTHYRTLHRLLDFSCASPASPHLPAYLSKRIAVLFRSSFGRGVAHFAKRKTACSETRGNHLPVARTPLLNPPRTPMSLICPDGYRHHLRSFNPSLRMTLFHSFGPTPPTFHTLTRAPTLTDADADATSLPLSAPLPLCPFCPSPLPLSPRPLPPMPTLGRRILPSGPANQQCRRRSLGLSRPLLLDARRAPGRLSSLPKCPLSPPRRQRRPQTLVWDRHPL